MAQVTAAVHIPSLAWEPPEDAGAAEKDKIRIKKNGSMRPPSRGQGGKEAQDRVLNQGDQQLGLGLVGL